jgi:CheY-like chemotaxis protein
MSAPTVLVIDDDEDVQELLIEVLTQAGYQVTTTDSVLGAVALAQRLQPSVILLDLGLPFKSGASLLADLRDEPLTASIPVIVVSGIAEHLPRERRDLAYAVVGKPFEPAKLVRLVQAAQTATTRQSGPDDAA